MSQHYRPRLRLTLAEQELLRDIFSIAVNTYEYDHEDENEVQATKLFTKIMSKTQ